MEKYIIAAYLTMGFLCSGHWFANTFDAHAPEGYARNPASAISITLLWPTYASYLFFKDD